MDTEQEFDNEYDVSAIAQNMVDKIKSEVKSKYGKKKRHKQ